MRTRASSENVGKPSSYQVKLSRKRTFHYFMSTRATEKSLYSFAVHIPGRFLGALLETVSRWHSSESSYSQECSKTPGFISMMKSFTAGSEKQYLDYENYRHITFKWHFKLTKSLVILLESKDYMQVSLCSLAKRVTWQ